MSDLSAGTSQHNHNMNSARLRIEEGSVTYEELTTVLGCVSTVCGHCGNGMTLICIEPRCDCIFCERCDSVDHLCHRTNELRVLLMGQLHLQSSITQVDLIKRFVLPYLQNRASKDRSPPAYWLREIKYYERFLERLRWFDALSNTLLEIISTLRSNSCNTVLSEQFRERFGNILTHLSFQKEKVPLLTQDIDEKVQKFTNKRFGWGIQLPKLQPQSLRAVEFLHNTLLGSNTTLAKKRYGQLVPSGRLRRLFVNKKTEPIRKDSEDQPSYIEFAVFDPSFALPETLK